MAEPEQSPRPEPEAADETERPQPRRENSGEYLWRVLKPAGCVFVLLLFIAFLVFCFTYRGAPPESPAPAQTAEQTVPAEHGSAEPS